MILRFVALSASSLPKEMIFPRKISACRSSSSRPHVGDDGTPPGTRVVSLAREHRVNYLRKLKGFLGSRGTAFGRGTSSHHRLAATDDILSRSFSHL